MIPRFTIKTYISAIFDAFLAHGRSVVLTQRGFFILLELNPPCTFPVSTLPTIFIKKYQGSPILWLCSSNETRIQRWKNKIDFPIFSLVQLQTHARPHDTTSIINSSDGPSM